VTTPINGIVNWPKLLKNPRGALARVADLLHWLDQNAVIAEADERQ
jgi:hypothetical protein